MFTETDLVEIAELVEARLGLSFPPSRHNDLIRGLNRICEEHHFHDSETCMNTIRAATTNGDLYNKIVAHLTIGETYFFRDPYLYDELATNVLQTIPDWSMRRLNIWSAGCSSGEEPYSLVINAAQNRFLHRLDTVLATDISVPALEKARRGLYSEWSFRNAPHWLRERYFTRPSAKQWQLDSNIMAAVRFDTFNLATTNWPDPFNLVQAEQFDVILCRNVLIYFSAALGNRIITQFMAALKSGGILVLGPSELSNLDVSAFEREQFGNLTIFRKRNHQPATESVPTPATQTVSEIGPSPASPALEPHGVLLSSEGSAESRDADNHLRSAKALLGSGHYDRALAECRKAVSTDRSTFDAYYLMGSIQLEIGMVEAAERAFIRALYLHPQHVMAQFGLGEVYRLAGKYGQALSQLRLVRKYASALPPNQALSHGEGVTAGVLCQLIDASMKAMADGATV